MRISTFLTCTALYGVLAFAGDAHVATYIDGNLDGWSPNSGATVDASGIKTIEVRAGNSKVDVPFSGIARAEAGALIDHPNEEPLYKIWTLPGRFFNKRQTQNVQLDFKTDAGENRTLTLEMERADVESLLARIEERTSPQAAAQKAGWWGDSVWKTRRNASEWGGSGEVAARE